ncbi:replication endonuclease, partial [Escherichia coli]|nr:replication endonuclease [Escherichia coli]
TRGNNCPRKQNEDKEETEIQQNSAATSAPPPTIPPDADVGKWLKSLTPHQRRMLTRTLRKKPPEPEQANNKQPEKPDATTSSGERWCASARAMGINLSKDQIQHLAKAGVLRLGGQVLHINNGELTCTRDKRTDSRISRLWERLSRNHGVRASDIRYNPQAYYADMLRRMGEASLPAARERQEDEQR